MRYREKGFVLKPGMTGEYRTVCETATSLEKLDKSCGSA